AAYTYAAKPEYLYNIAQAYRLLKENEKALFFYKTYLRESPNADNREVVTIRINDLEALLAQTQRPPNDSLPAPAPPAVAPPPLPPPPPQHGDRRLEIGGLALGGAGVAAAVAGTVLLAKARAGAGDLDDGAAAGAPWTPERAAQLDDLHRDEKIGAV